MRLFVSVDLPDEFTEPLATLQSAVADASGLNFVDPSSAHVTLKFLGDVAESRVSALETELAAAVDQAGVGPFTAHLGGLGVFPDLEYIRVVWLGVEEGGAELTRLHEAIEARTTAMGFDAETHAFTPHVTLARMEHAGGKEQVQTFVRDRDPSVGAFDVDQVRLTESTLGPDGPVYSTVDTFEL
jgi:2'-5' RNA ligase